MIDKICHIFVNKKVQTILFCVSICILFCLIFILNRLYPLYADDWIYTFVFGENPPRRISGLSDIITSQYNHYTLWGGRSVVHAIAQVLLLTPSFFLDIINTLAFILFIWIVYNISNQNNPINTFVFIVIALLMWFCLPLFTSTVIWITGSANYLWGTLIVLLFIRPYYYFVRTGISSNSIWKVLLFFIFGIVAGWTNENMSVATIFMIAILCIYQKRNDNLPYWMISGLIGLCIGCIIMLAAPGNYIRSEAISESLNLEQESIFMQIVDRLTVFLSVYKRHLLLLLIIYFLALILFFKTNDKNENNFLIIFISLLLMITAHVAFFILVASPVFPERALFCVVTFMVLGTSILYSNIKFKGTFSQLANILFIMLLCVVFSIDYNRKYSSIYLISKTFRDREMLLEEQKNEGKEDIVLEGRIGIHHKFGFVDLDADPYAPLNVDYARFYNVHTVRVIDVDNK